MGLTSRERFRRTFSGDTGCRPPLWGDGIRDDVRAVWESKGGLLDSEWERALGIERMEVVQPDLRWSESFFSPARQQDRVLTAPADDLSRYPEDWAQQVREFSSRDFPVGLRVSRGFFLTCGVEDWSTLAPLLIAAQDEPEQISSRMRSAAEFAARVLQRAYDSVEFDFVLFSEPIASNFGPVVSPALLRSVCETAYRLLWGQAHRNNVSHAVFQTYGNTECLIPAFKSSGATVFWSGETGPSGVSYRRIRAQHGNELGLIGGIDSAILRLSEPQMEARLREDLQPLLASGRYLPMLDGRVRQGTSYAAYASYRRALLHVVNGA